MLYSFNYCVIIIFFFRRHDHICVTPNAKNQRSFVSLVDDSRDSVPYIAIYINPEKVSHPECLRCTLPDMRATCHCRHAS